MIYNQISRTIRKNWDISVVMPFFKKNLEFERTIKHNAKYFQRPGVEVIICIDEPESKPKLVEILEKYKQIDWKVFENQKPHGWRNPAKTINVGIKNASKEFILVIGPDSQMHTDVIYRYRFLSQFYSDKYFFVGNVAFISTETALRNNEILKFRQFPYGSIFCRKKFFDLVRGYNESLDEWGGDDDNVRSRLSRAGFTKMVIPEAVLLHIDKTKSENVERYRKAREMPVEQLYKIFIAPLTITNSSDWGRDFDNFVYGEGYKNTEGYNYDKASPEEENFRK